MIESFKAKKGTTAESIFLFGNKEVDLTQFHRLVPLFGANGSGKSTLLKSIIEFFTIEQELRDSFDNGMNPPVSRYTKEEFQRINSKKQLDIEYSKIESQSIFKYFDSKDNFKINTGSYKDNKNPLFLCDKLNSQRLSEGQSIIYSTNGLFELIENNLECRDDLDYLILMDEIDSGLSIDNLSNYLNRLLGILDDRDDIQIIFSFNNPWVVRFCPDVLSMYDGEMHHIEDEEEMYRELNKNAAILNKTRKDENGDYIIY